MAAPAAHRVGEWHQRSRVNQLLRDFDQARTMVKRMRHGPRGFAGLKRGGR
jgi:hypothetical protein